MNARAFSSWLVLLFLAACPRPVGPGETRSVPVVVESLSLREDREPLREPPMAAAALLAFDGDTLVVRGHGWDKDVAQLSVGGAVLPGMVERGDTELVARLPAGFTGGEVRVVSAERTSAPGPGAVVRLGPGGPAATALGTVLDPTLDARITAAGTAAPGQEPRGMVAVAFRFGTHDLDATHVALVAATDGQTLVRALPPPAPHPRHVVTTVVPSADASRPWFDPAAILDVRLALQVAPDYRGTPEAPTLPVWLDLDHRESSTLDALPLGLVRGVGGTFLASNGRNVWAVTAAAPKPQDHPPVWDLGQHDGLRWGLLPAGADPVHSADRPELLAVTCDWDADAGRYLEMQVHHVPLAEDGQALGGGTTSRWLRPGAQVCADLAAPEDCRALRECQEGGACREALACAVHPTCAPLLACLLEGGPVCTSTFGCTSAAECRDAFQCSSHGTCAAALPCADSRQCQDHATAGTCGTDSACTAWAACQADAGCATRLSCATSASCTAALQEGASARLAGAARCLEDGECATAARCDAAAQDGDDASACPALTRCFVNACSYRRDTLVSVAPGWAVQSTPRGWNSWREVERSSHSVCPLDLEFGHLVPLQPDGVVASAVTAVAGRLLTVPMPPDGLEDIPEVWSWAAGAGAPATVAPARVPYAALLPDSQAPLAYAIPNVHAAVDVLGADGELLHSWPVLGAPRAAWPADGVTAVAVQPDTSALLWRTDAAGLVQATAIIPDFDAWYLEQAAGHAPSLLWGRRAGAPGLVRLAAVEVAAGLGSVREELSFSVPAAQVMTLAAVTADQVVLALCGAPGAAGVPCPAEAYSACTQGEDGEDLAGWLAVADRSAARTAATVPVFVEGSCGVNLVRQAPASAVLGGALVDTRGGRLWFDVNDDAAWSGFVLRAVDLSVAPPRVLGTAFPDPRSAVLSPAGRVVGVFSGTAPGTLELGVVEPGGSYRRVHAVTRESLVVAVSPDERWVYEGEPGTLVGVALDGSGAVQRWTLPGTPRGLAVDSTGARVVATLDTGDAVVLLE